MKQVSGHITLPGVVQTLGPQRGLQGGRGPILTSAMSGPPPLPLPLPPTPCLQGWGQRGSAHRGLDCKSSLGPLGRKRRLPSDRMGGSRASAPRQGGCSNSILISAEAPRAHAQSQGQGKLLIDSGNKATLTTERWGGLSGCWVLCSRTVVQLLSCVRLFSILWTADRQTSLSFTISWSLLKFMSIKSVMPSNHLILCRPLLLPPSVFPSIRVFSSESVLRIRWPRYRSFSFSISPSSEYSRWISFRTDWLDLLAVQGTLKRLLQHHSSKASVLQSSTFFMVQLSHPYMRTGKTIALIIRTFVGKIACF